MTATHLKLFPARPGSSLKTPFFLLLTASFLFAQNVRGETPTPAPAAQSQGDRSKSGGAAQAAAIAGAAMAGMGCVMMMNEARKMPPGKDKNMTMMMAMQQCAQAAQSAAAAAQNDKAKNASQSDIPKMAGLDIPKATPEPKSSETPFAPATEEKKEELAASGIDIPEPGQIPAPVLEEPKIDSGVSPEPSGLTNGIAISSLKSIDGSRVDFNEANKNDTPTITPPGMGGSGFFGGGKPLTADEIKKLSSNEGAASGKAGRGAKGEEEAPLAMEGGGSGSNSDSGNSAFDQLLSQLMGGGPPDAAGTGGSGSADLVALPRDKSTGTGPNIFEYASYRYRVASYDESRVGLKKQRHATRTLASEKPATVALKND